MTEPLVVRADELRAVLKPYVDAQTHEYDEALRSGEWQSGNQRTGKQASPILGGTGWLAHASGITDRQVRSILNGERTWVSLTHADALLTAAGLNHALRDGRCRIVPNPRWSTQHWHAHMRACGVEDPEQVL